MSTATTITLEALSGQPAFVGPDDRHAAVQCVNAVMPEGVAWNAFSDADIASAQRVINDALRAMYRPLTVVLVKKDNTWTCAGITLP
jgi:hypothetical protein